MKDWTGNKKTTFASLGASNHTEKEREERDFYATDPTAIDDLTEVEEFYHKIWEPACGNGHMSIRLRDNWKFNVFSSDIIKRDFECKELDFLTYDKKNVDCDIVTNPPYKYAQEFIEKALEVVAPGRKVAMFLKLTFLEGQKRKIFFEKYPPKKIYVYSKRKNCAMNGDFETYKSNSAICYAWFIWVKGFTGEPTIAWI